MKTAPFYAAAILAGLICLPVRGSAYLTAGQEFMGALPAASAEGATLEASSIESSLYANGTRAIMKVGGQTLKQSLPKLPLNTASTGMGPSTGRHTRRTNLDWPARRSIRAPI